MWKCLLPLLATALHAAVVRGTVVENLTGYPLQRANVTIEPVPGSPGKPMSVHTDRYGSFVFAGEPAGIYLLSASRAPFLTCYYGQKRWNSSGQPLAVTEDEAASVTIRLMRYSAVSGTVVDENDVGQPEFSVAAYRNTRPPQLIANATADERGVYRIYGLLPGSYLIRTMGKQLEDIGYKPTFARETETVDQARLIDVEMEQEARELNVRPLRGQLYRLSVEAATMDPKDMPVTITLVSEMGRQTVEAASHTFTGLPRGDYEVFATAPTDTRGVKQGAYQRISLGKDSAVFLSLRRIPDVVFQFDGLPVRAAGEGMVRVLARRKDLAGSHETQVLDLENDRATLAVGPWEFALAPVDGYFVSGFSGPGPLLRNQRADGWNEATITSGGRVRFTLTAGSSSLHGTVSSFGSPVIGAPVFLEPMDLEPERRVTDTYVSITDVHGQYRFGGLAPGRYRVLSSFEYRMPDSRAMEESGAQELTIDTRTDIARDLSLYVIP